MGRYHWYDDQGRPHHSDDLKAARAKGHYGSVTTVLGIVKPNPRLQTWIDRKNCNLAIDLLEHGEPRSNCADRAIEVSYEELRATATWGTAVHDRCEKYNIDGTVIDDSYLKYWTSWIDYSDKYVKEMLFPERTFVDHEDKLAGTVDLVFEHVNLGICVGDYKNREFKPNKQKAGNPIECGWYVKDQQQLSYYSYMVMNDLKLDKLPPIFSFGFDSKVPRQMSIKEWKPKKTTEICRLSEMPKHGVETG